ncbi:hypothetical protein HY745_09270, partial [Candidatus Desantisbacteria bacterium]|nr:hypothetical protein [Candidatus Desantisbacteria bacterium]
MAKAKNKPHPAESKSDDHSHGASPSVNPLEKIKEKELELRGKYLEIKKQGELIVAEARKKASEIRRTAAERAAKEAQSYYEGELIKIRGENSGPVNDKELVEVKKTGDKNLNQAREFLIRNIIPL